MGVTDGESRNLSDLIKTNKRVCDDQSRGLMKMMELMELMRGKLHCCCERGKAIRARNQHGRPRSQLRQRATETIILRTASLLDSRMPSCKEVSLLLTKDLSPEID
jgi:hypothetical protein